MKKSENSDPLKGFDLRDDSIKAFLNSRSAQLGGITPQQSLDCGGCKNTVASMIRAMEYHAT